MLFVRTKLIITKYIIINDLIGKLIKLRLGINVTVFGHMNCESLV